MIVPGIGLLMVAPTASLETAQIDLRSGRLDEAENGCRVLLDTNPRNAEALLLLGAVALRRGDSLQATTMFAQAVAAQPEHVAARMNLGLALEAAGNLDGAIGAFSEVLKRRPEAYIARLHLGLALYRQGDANGGLLACFRACNEAQQQGRWRDEASTEPGLREPVQRAMRLVNRGRRELYSRMLEPLQAEFGRIALDRVETALANYLGERIERSPDPRQQPTFLYFPGLPAQPYLDRSAFDWLESWEQQTDPIREELLAVLPHNTGQEPVFHNEQLAAANLRNDHGAASWNGYYFYRHGELRADNAAVCPKTFTAIERLPLARIREHAPETMFSVLIPGTHLLPHRGVTNTRLVAHLPLIVPPDCALKVAGQEHVWREGRALVFDDTYEHEAWNRSEQTRVVLICDIWNPYLSDVERRAVTLLVEAIGDFRKSSDAA